MPTMTDDELVDAFREIRWPYKSTDEDGWRISVRALYELNRADDIAAAEQRGYEQGRRYNLTREAALANEIADLEARLAKAEKFERWIRFWLPLVRQALLRLDSDDALDSLALLTAAPAEEPQVAWDIRGKEPVLVEKPLINPLEDLERVGPGFRSVASMSKLDCYTYGLQNGRAESRTYIVNLEARLAKAEKFEAWVREYEDDLSILRDGSQAEVELRELLSTAPAEEPQSRAEQKAPLPPEILADAHQDRIHPTSGRLIAASPVFGDAAQAARIAELEAELLKIHDTVARAGAHAKIGDAVACTIDGIAKLQIDRAEAEAESTSLEAQLADRNAYIARFEEAMRRATLLDCYVNIQKDCLSYPDIDSVRHDGTGPDAVRAFCELVDEVTK